MNGMLAMPVIKLSVFKCTWDLFTLHQLAVTQPGMHAVVMAICNWGSARVCCTLDMYKNDNILYCTHAHISNILPCVTVLILLAEPDPAPEMTYTVSGGALTSTQSNLLEDSSMYMG